MRMLLKGRGYPSFLVQEGIIQHSSYQNSVGLASPACSCKKPDETERLDYGKVNIGAVLTAVSRDYIICCLVSPTFFCLGVDPHVFALYPQQPRFFLGMDLHAVSANGGSSEAARPSREFASYPLLRHPATGTCGTGSGPVRLGAPSARPWGGRVCGLA